MGRTGAVEGWPQVRRHCQVALAETGASPHFDAHSKSEHPSSLTAVSSGWPPRDTLGNAAQLSKCTKTYPPANNMRLDLWGTAKGGTPPKSCRSLGHCGHAPPTTHRPTGPHAAITRRWKLATPLQSPWAPVHWLSHWKKIFFGGGGCLPSLTFLFRMCAHSWPTTWLSKVTTPQAETPSE